MTRQEFSLRLFTTYGEPGKRASFTLKKDMTRHELFDELDAFDPKWQSHYPTLGSAALAAGVEGLYYHWRSTPSGRRYLETVGGLPDTYSERTVYSCLPYKLNTIGKTDAPEPDSSGQDE